MIANWGWGGDKEKAWLFPAGIFSGSLAMPTLGSPWQEWIKQPSKSKWTTLASTVLLKRLKQVVMSKASQLNAIVRGSCLDWRKLGKQRLSTLPHPSSVSLRDKCRSFTHIQDMRKHLVQASCPQRCIAGKLGASPCKPNTKHVSHMKHSPSRSRSCTTQKRTIDH